MRRYNIDKVYRRRVHGAKVSQDGPEDSSYPREQLEAVFDVVKDLSSRLGAERLLAHLPGVDAGCSSSECRESLVAAVESEVLSAGIAVARKFNSLLSAVSYSQASSSSSLGSAATDNGARENNMILVRLWNTAIGDAILELCQLKLSSARSTVYTALHRIMPRLVHETFCQLSEQPPIGISESKWLSHKYISLQANINNNINNNNNNNDDDDDNMYYLLFVTT